MFRLSIKEDEGGQYDSSKSTTGILLRMIRMRHSQVFIETFLFTQSDCIVEQNLTNA